MRQSDATDSQSAAHKTVLLNEACESLLWDQSGTYIDGTFGRGGHARRILKHLSANGRLLGFDKDPQAVEVGVELAAQDKRFSMHSGSFLGVADLGLDGEVAGILLDLGVSSPQLDNAERGFSFQHDGPLDMRMDPESGASAAEWLAIVDEAELCRVLKTYGEERFARRIAAAIVQQRQEKAITRTAELAELIKQAHPRWEKDKHPATRSFQAIRIHLNQELEELEGVLGLAERLLVNKGRLVVISFHSLEDRLTKRHMRGSAQTAKVPRHIPLRESELEKPALRLLGKAIRSSADETRENRRARSAIMRVAERVREQAA
ncbi:MAG: 16S rRNA (cytosine(1402)-N(4))-methyltransferase RsmH [Pseudomonadales bacterium]